MKHSGVSGRGVSRVEVWLTAGVLMLAMLLLARGCKTNGADEWTTHVSDVEDQTRRQGDLPPAPILEQWYRLAHLRGDVSAPIQILEFANFLCSYCRALHQVVDSLEVRYPNLVAVRWLHFVEPGPTRVGSNRFLAKSAECASDQRVFNEFADLVFAAGPGVSSRQGVIRIARQIAGIEEVEFLACLDSGTHESTLDRHNALADQAGIKVTPTWFINGRGIAGTLPFRTVDSIVVAIFREQRP